MAEFDFTDGASDEVPAPGGFSVPLDFVLDLETEFSAYMRERQEERSYFIGPSGASRCIKQQAYQYLEIEPPKKRSTDAADLGTLLHLGWSALIKAQFDPSEREADVKITIQGMPRDGSADDVDWVNRIVTDLKTAKDTVFQSWLNKGTPYEEYWGQLELYALGLRQMYGGDWTMRIKAINRETGAQQDYERPADPEVGLALAAKAAAKHTVLMASVENAESGADPLEIVDLYPREGKGPGRGMPCDYCDFASLCWSEPDPGSPYSPQSDTIREDREALGQVAAEYLEASAESRKWEERRKDAAAFLKGVVGVFPGPDGGNFSITQVGGNEKSAPDCEAMQSTLKGLGLSIPMKEYKTARYARVVKKKGK